MRKDPLYSLIGIALGAFGILFTLFCIIAVGILYSSGDLVLAGTETLFWIVGIPAGLMCTWIGVREMTPHSRRFTGYLYTVLGSLSTLLALYGLVLWRTSLGQSDKPYIDYAGPLALLGFGMYLVKVGLRNIYAKNNGVDTLTGPASGSKKNALSNLIKVLLSGILVFAVLMTLFMLGMWKFGG